VVRTWCWRISLTVHTNRNTRLNTHSNIHLNILEYQHSNTTLEHRYDNETSPGEPFTSYGVESCSTGSPREEGPARPDEYPDTCLGLDAAMIDTFADYDFSTSNYTYVVFERDNMTCITHSYLTT